MELRANARPNQNSYFSWVERFELFHRLANYSCEPLYRTFYKFHDIIHHIEAN